MDITTLIVRDHDTAFALIHGMQDALEPQSFLRASVKKLGHALVQELQIHARAEELSLYASLLALKDAPPTVLKHLDHKGRVECMFYGLGSDGTVGAKLEFDDIAVDLGAEGLPDFMQTDDLVATVDGDRHLLGGAGES